MNAIPSSAAPGKVFDWDQARFNMIEQQIRPWEVLDPTVLDLLFRVRRENFVPATHRNLAFVDMEIPIGHGEVMLSPKLEARMLQSLAIQSGDVVLEVGTGTGYMTALLASLGGHVYSVDIQAEFTRLAGINLTENSIRNITLETGDAAPGWPSRGPYDAIVLTGSLPVLPDTFAEMLKAGGRMIAVVGEAPAMEARLITRSTSGDVHATSLFETSIRALMNAPQREKFLF